MSPIKEKLSSWEAGVFALLFFASIIIGNLSLLWDPFLLFGTVAVLWGVWLLVPWWWLRLIVGASSFYYSQYVWLESVRMGMEGFLLLVSVPAGAAAVGALITMNSFDDIRPLHVLVGAVVSVLPMLVVFVRLFS